MAEDSGTNIISEYFAGGWRVAPFVKAEKNYVGVAKWPSKAASNFADLQLLVQELRQMTNIEHYVLGIVPPPGKYIVDIDLKNNPSALELWMERVRSLYGQTTLPDFVVKTKSGGYHLYYDSGTENKIGSPTSIFGPESGIDIRGSTGMVIAASSYGSEEEWSSGLYMVIKGKPTLAATVLPIGNLLAGAKSEETWETILFTRVNNVLRDVRIPDMLKYQYIPQDITLPASNRDNLIFRLVRLCRQAGLELDAAKKFAIELARRCEITNPEEDTEFWIRSALDKVDRAYSHSGDLNLTSIFALYEELDNAGCVTVTTGLKVAYYFIRNSPILKVRSGEYLTEEVFKHRFRGVRLFTEEGEIAATKVINQYQPKERAYGASMHPREVSFFDFDGKRYVNTYQAPFGTFLPVSSELLKHDALPGRYKDFVAVIAGGKEDEVDLMLQKLAWIVKYPERRRPVATFIYSHTRGVGKDIFADILSMIIGRGYCKRFQIDVLLDKFSYFHDCIVSIFSEVQMYAGAKSVSQAKDFMGRIKSLITEKSQMINQKFQAPYVAPMYTNFMMLSNYAPAALIEPGDRRIEVFHSIEKKFDQAKFGALADLTNDAFWHDPQKEVERNHAIYCLYDMLREYPTQQDFDKVTAISTVAKDEVLADSLPSSIRWLIENLPPLFTREIVQLAAARNPYSMNVSYAFDQLRDYTVNELTRYGRLNQAPRIIKMAGLTGESAFQMTFAAVKSDIYYLASKFDPAGKKFTDTEIKASLSNWWRDLNNASLELPGSNHSQPTSLH
jgi:hypothetical protein